MAELFTLPARATDSNGDNLSGAQLFFYATGTTTPQNVYSDAALNTSLGAVVTADSGGKFVGIYLDPVLTYRAVLKTSDGASTIYDIDPVGLKNSAANISFTPTGTGAVTRQLDEKVVEIVSVTDFGAATGNTGAANVTAFQAALNDGRAIFIPNGTYSLNAKLTSTGKPVTIYTDGQVTLKWLTGSATQGLDFTFSNLTTQTLSIGDIELVTEREGGGTAIKAVWPDGASGFNRLWQLGKIRMRGSDIVGQVGYWDYGLDTTNGWLGFGEALDFYGKGSGVTPLSTAAWVARGKSTDSRVHIRARYAKSMLLIAGFSEGLDVSGSFAVACDYAVDCSGTSGLNTPGFVWIGGHAACFKGGIRSVNILQGNVSNLLFYKRTDSAQNFIGFDLDSASTEWQISDCKVFSLANQGGGTTTAIKDAGVNNITVNLRSVGCDTDVNVVSGASGFSHTFSRSDNTRGAITQGDADGQVVCLPGGAFGNTTSYFDTLAANSATPSILGYRKWGSCGHILTANSIATTITDFTGGFPGDEFVLQANDANTTVQHNAGMQLNGGVNKVLASAETIRLRRVTSTVWKQV